MPSQSEAIPVDLGAELRAVQILSFALHEAAFWAQDKLPEVLQKMTIPPLLLGASRAVALASAGGLDTPVEIFALAARNTFELYLRFKYLLQSNENCQTWREEAPTDQLQIYEGFLKLNPPEQMRKVFESEMERVTQHAAGRGLEPKRLMTVRELARATNLDAEYDGFYKLYSKFIHPSSFLTNWPDAASTPMYREAFSYNLQVYGHLILSELNELHGLPTSEILKNAELRLDGLLQPN